MVLFDVHTLVEDGPVRHYQQYPTPERAEQMRRHLSGVLHVELAVDPVERPDPAPEVTR